MKRFQVGNDFDTESEGHEKLREKAYTRYRVTDDGRFWISVRRNSKLTRTTARAAELTIIVAVDYGTINSHFVQLKYISVKRG